MVSGPAATAARSLFASFTLSALSGRERLGYGMLNTKITRSATACVCQMMIRAREEARALVQSTAHAVPGEMARNIVRKTVFR